MMPPPNPRPVNRISSSFAPGDARAATVPGAADAHCLLLDETHPICGCVVVVALRLVVRDCGCGQATCAGVTDLRWIAYCRHGQRCPDR